MFLSLKSAQDRGQKINSKIEVCNHAVSVMHKRFQKCFAIQTNLSLAGELLKSALRVKVEHEQ